jgi:nucleoid-associated protein EbfC
VSKKNRGGMGGMGGLGGLGDLGAIMRQAQEQADKMKQKMDEKLRDKTVEGTAGGGMVTVTCTGTLEVRSVKLDPSLLAPGEKDMLEDLIAAATNVALKKARALQDEAQQGELSSMMGGGGMPDLSKLLGGP